ncbi:MAG: CusA/CzcA family heavy metal efflux RND transporter [Planctomycetota bacterium]
MIQGLINFSLNNRLLVIIMWLVIGSFGLRSMLSLPIDAVPDVTNVQVQVLTNAPGLAPEEVERFITFPVESSMSGIANVEKIRSVTRFGLSAVTVVFEEGTDIYWARQNISERLVDAREMIPAGYGTPEMGPISTGLGEIYQFEVRGEDYSLMELRTILDWNINYLLRSVPGVVEVNSNGGMLKTWQVTLNPERMNALGVAVGDILTALEGSNRNVGGGYLVHASEQFLIRGEALIESLEDLGSIEVKTGEGGVAIHIRDIGTPEYGSVIRQGAASRDGRGEAVMGVVMMLMGANSREVSSNVHAKIEEIITTLPDGVTIETIYDRNDLVDRTIATVAKNLAEGGLLVILVLLLLLGNLRAGILVAMAIPLSMLVAFTAMKWAGVSGNLMSLGALDFGLLVDGSVVLIENILRRLHERSGDHKTPHIEKIRAACLEIARPVVFAVGIIMIVYIPILALQGIEGKMFGPMAKTVVFALAGSLLCALTFMPAMASLILRKGAEKDTLLFRFFRKLYLPALGGVMRRPGITATVAVLVFVGGTTLIKGLGAEFIPRLDEGALAIQISRLPSISLEESLNINQRVEKLVMDEFPEITTIFSRTGRPEIATDPMGVELTDAYLMLEPRDTWRFANTDELVAAMEKRLTEAIPGVMFSFSQPIELRVAELISGVRSDVGILVYGGSSSMAEHKRVGDLVAAAIRDVDGMEEVKVEQVTGLPNLRIRVNRDALGRYGVRATDVLDVIEALAGKQAGTVFEGQKSFALQVRYPEEVRDSPEAIRAILVRGTAPDGTERMVPLDLVADIVVEEGPAQISRDNISRRIAVEANVRGRDLASAVAEAQQAVKDKVQIPPGWTIHWGGQFENLAEASARLAWLVPLSLLLIFALLFTTFNSARLGLLIFLNVPLAASGGIFALWIRGYPFSISAGVGFIALFGVAVLNGVVLVSSIVQLQAQGMSAFDAARKAAQIRLRPVLMTALVASLGFLPMAMATSAGAEVQRPLATVVIGGLITCTLLTLLVLPAIYSRFGSRSSAEEIPSS